MSDICGICGSSNTGSGSWSGGWCNDCGAKEIIDEWQANIKCKQCNDLGTYINSEGYSINCSCIKGE